MSDGDVFTQEPSLGGSVAIILGAKALNCPTKDSLAYDSTLFNVMGTLTFARRAG